LAKERGDVSTVRRSPNVRKSKAVAIEKWAGFAMYLVVDAKKCRTETLSFGPTTPFLRKELFD
jgi:hypothetical protein